MIEAEFGCEYHALFADVTKRSSTSFGSAVISGLLITECYGEDRYRLTPSSETSSRMTDTTGIFPYLPPLGR